MAGYEGRGLSGQAAGMAARVAAIVAGLWLMVAPALLNTSGEFAGKLDRTLGPIGASLAFLAIWGIARGLRWGTLPIGLFLAVGPWLLDVPTGAAISDLAVGLVFILTPLVRGPVEERYGGGWLSLKDPAPGL